MKIVMINGQNHKGSTYNIGKQFIDKIGGEVEEYFLPKDFGEFCIGCNNCFMFSETKCPHYQKLKDITDTMDKADLLVFTSPVYVYHATGSMKSFLDHYGWRWMVHRPEEKMFHKQAVCIATAAGAGMKSTLKDMADSMFFWGIPKTYKIGIAVRAIDYSKVDDKIKKKISKKIDKLANKVQSNIGKVKPGFKTKCFFYIMKILQKSGWNESDANYWKEKGWTYNKRPWKNK